MNSAASSRLKLVQDELEDVSLPHEVEG